MRTGSSILIAEDESIVALDMISILKRSGYDAVSFVRNSEALFTKVHENPPSLIIMDIFLNGKNTGFETAQKIWVNHNIPVVFISGIDISELKKNLDFTKCDFITKPFSESDLLTSIKKFLTN